MSIEIELSCDALNCNNSIRLLSVPTTEVLNGLGGMNTQICQKIIIVINAGLL